jgi:hypothetical protein
MKTIRLRLPVLVAALFLVCQTAAADTNTVYVGDTAILLPSPKGFFRYDGKNSKIDNLEQSLLPSSNRLLAIFGSEENLADVLVGRFPKVERQFNAQSMRSLESLTVTQAFFNELKPGLRETFSAQSGNENFRDVIKEVETNASSAISAVSHLSANLKIGEMISLGVFDDTKDSLCFSALAKVQVSTSTNSYVTVIGCCIIRVSDRVFYLYSMSLYRDKSDIEWARRSIQRWRDAVLKANAQ